jgi:hypothetical protein
MRGAPAALFVLGLAACAQVPDATAPAVCPAIRSAEAWINAMPGPAPKSRTLIVLLQMETPDRWMLKPQDPPLAGTVLRLDLAEGGAGHPGSAGYRYEATPRPGRIEVYCNGRLQRTIDEIISAR